MLKVAWRNLWRNRTRTGVTIAAIALTYALYLLMMGIQEYTYGQMEDAAANAAGGLVLVQGEGFQDSQLNDILIEDGDARLEKTRNADGVEVATGRVIINGLLSTSASSFPGRIQGIDPDVDAEFQNVERYLSEGTFLSGERDDPLVLGSKIAEDLEVEVGDRVILTATAPDGEMRRALFHLSGVLNTGSPLSDKSLAFTTIPAARKALDLDDELTQIGVLGSPPPEALKANVVGALDDAPDDDIEVLTWAEAMPDLVGFIEMDRAYGDVFAIVLFLVVLFAIMNTFLMVVMERVRELGMLAALGLTPMKLVQLVLAETILLTVVALVIGFGLGYSGHLLVDTFGIDMSAMYGSDSVEISGVELTDTMVYSTVSVQRWFNATVSVFFMVLFSAAYPAYKAAKSSPAEAMRFYE